MEVSVFYDIIGLVYNLQNLDKCTILALYESKFKGGNKKW